MYTIITVLIVLRNDAINKIYILIIHKILNSTVIITSKNTIYGALFQQGKTKKKNNYLKRKNSI